MNGSGIGFDLSKNGRGDSLNDRGRLNFERGILGIRGNQPPSAFSAVEELQRGFVSQRYHYNRSPLRRIRYLCDDEVIGKYPRTLHAVTAHPDDKCLAAGQELDGNKHFRGTVFAAQHRFASGDLAD